MPSCLFLTFRLLLLVVLLRLPLNPLSGDQNTVVESFTIFAQLPFLPHLHSSSATLWCCYFRFSSASLPTLTTAHRRSQDFCWGGGIRPTPSSLASVVHTLEAVAGSWGSVSARAVSRVMVGAPERNKNSQKI